MQAVFEQHNVPTMSVCRIWCKHPVTKLKRQRNKYFTRCTTKLNIRCEPSLQKSTDSEETHIQLTFLSAFITKIQKWKTPGKSRKILDTHHQYRDYYIIYTDHTFKHIIIIITINNNKYTCPDSIIQASLDKKKSKQWSPCVTWESCSAGDCREKPGGPGEPWSPQLSAEGRWPGHYPEVGSSSAGNSRWGSAGQWGSGNHSSNTD